MTTPFETLGVPEDADDTAIKKAYLARVREFPPEREPEHFQVIRAAYETLRGPRERIAWRLFKSDVPDPSPLLNAWLARATPRRPDLSVVHKVLEVGLKEIPPT
ncbi:Heat shock protein DnaJ domain protein [Gammaproteobacteria bacterium]